MGKYEEQLKAIATAQDWSVPMLKGFERTLPDLSDLMRKLAGATGLTGAAAEAAQQSFLSLQDGFDQLHENVVALNRSIESANCLRSEAAQTGLPSATLDPAAHAAILVAGTVVVPGLGTLAAEGGIQLYENFLRGQREDAAHESLEKLQSALADQSLSVRHVKEFNPSTPSAPTTPESTESTDANWPGPRSYAPTFNPGGGGYPGPDSAYAGLGGGGNSGSSGGSDWGSGGSNSGGHHTTPSVDGDLGGGYVPGSGGQGGANGGGLTPRLGSGMGGLIGGGASAAALAVGTRLGGSGMAGTGGGLGMGSAGGTGTNPGAGGLLGGSKGAVGSAGEGAGGSGAPGGRPGGAMMGGGQGGAGGGEKEKRSGLGGPMAPKLEDDEERGPRSAGAMAGGRDTPASD